MENRFGVKDFVIVVLLVVVIVMVALCMVQYDRQWAIINQTSNKLNDQARDLTIIRRSLEQGGVATAAATTRTSADQTAGFEDVIKSRSQPDYSAGDSLVSDFPSPPGKITPLVSQELSASQIQSYVLESLCIRDPDTLKWKPRLAQSWKISDDQLKFDFDLRRGVNFSDGTPFSADDVIFTYDWMRNKDVEDPRMLAYLDKLDRIEKTGDYSVRFYFKQPYFKSFEVVAGIGILSKAFYSQFTPKEFNESTGLLFGTGPYRLADPKTWRPEPGKPVELVRNERYWGVAPALDHVNWKIIGNPSAWATAFRNGDIDSLSPSPEQYDLMCADPALVARTQHFAIDIPNALWMYVAWSQKLDGKPTIFSDKHVRQAMTMLIDRQAIVKDILRGYGTVSTSCFSPLSPQADASIAPFPYDPNRAIQLLADAGFHMKDAVLTGPDGNPVSFQLSYKSTDPVRVHIASYIKDQLARAGIDVVLKPAELSVLIEQLKKRELPAYLGGWSGVLEQDPHQIFSTDAIPSPGDNFVSYSNLQLDALVDRARVTVGDEDKQMQLWHQVHQIIHEDQPYTFLFIQKDLEFLDGRFKGVRPTKIGLNSDAGWYVPSDMQKYK